MKKGVLSLPEIYKAIKLFEFRLGTESYQYYKSGYSVVAHFSQASQQLLAETTAHLETSLYLCLPILTAQIVPESCPKSLVIDFAVKTLDFLFK